MTNDRLCGTRCVSEKFVVEGFATVEGGDVTSSIAEGEGGGHAIALTMVIEGRQIGAAISPANARALAIALIEHAAWIDAQTV
jgi:hypothetical protein